jgi:hypothetical protein
MPEGADVYVVVVAPEGADRFDVASPTGGRFTLASGALDGSVTPGERVRLDMKPGEPISVHRLAPVH